MPSVPAHFSNKGTFLLRQFKVKSTESGAPAASPTGVSVTGPQDHTRGVWSSTAVIQLAYLPCAGVSIPFESMMHTACSGIRSPYFRKMYKFLPLFPQKLEIFPLFLFDLRFYVYWLNLRVLASYLF